MDKVIVITGASSGFGKGAALRFAGEGARLVLAARRAELVEDLAIECGSAGARRMDKRRRRGGARALRAHPA